MNSSSDAPALSTPKWESTVILDRSTEGTLYQFQLHIHLPASDLQARIFSEAWTAGTDGYGEVNTVLREVGKGVPGVEELITAWKFDENGPSKMGHWSLGLEETRGTPSSDKPDWAVVLRGMINLGDVTNVYNSNNLEEPELFNALVQPLDPHPMQAKEAAELIEGWTASRPKEYLCAPDIISWLIPLVPPAAPASVGGIYNVLTWDGIGRLSHSLSGGLSYGSMLHVALVMPHPVGDTDNPIPAREFSKLWMEGKYGEVGKFLLDLNEEDKVEHLGKLIEAWKLENGKTPEFGKWSLGLEEGPDDYTKSSSDARFWFVVVRAPIDLNEVAKDRPRTAEVLSTTAEDLSKMVEGLSKVDEDLAEVAKHRSEVDEHLSKVAKAPEDPDHPIDGRELFSALMPPGGPSPISPKEAVELISLWAAMQPEKYPRMPDILRSLFPENA